MLTFIQAAVFILYILFLRVKFGYSLDSISSSWYMLEGRSRFIFTFFCWVIGTLMLFQGGVLFILSGAGLCFVGTAVDYAGHGVDLIHYTGAVIGITFAFLGLAFEYNLIWPSVAFLIASAIHLKAGWQAPIWWIEIYAFLLIVAGFIVR